MGNVGLPVLLRERRRSLGLSTEDAARLCHVTQSTFSKWENGTNRPPDSKLAELASFLGITAAGVVLARSSEYVDEPPADVIAQVRADLDALRSQAEADRRELAEIRRMLARLPGTG